MIKKFPQPVQDILRKAGWFQGRKVLLSTIQTIDLEVFPKAQEVLSEFGGLHIGESGPGIDSATSDIDIAPDLCVHLTPELKRHGDSMGVRLFPLGEVHRGHGYLIIDEHGKTYLLSDELLLYAPTFSEGLEALLLGKRLPGKSDERTS